MRTFEIPVAGEVTVEIDDEGHVAITDFTAGDEAGLIGDDYAAYELGLPTNTFENGWRSKGELNEIAGGLMAMILADAEMVRAVRALAGLRALYERFGLSTDDGDGGPSGADVCEALYELMGTIGLEVA